MAQEELQESKLTKAGGRKPTHGCNYPMVGWPSVILTPMGPSLNLTREGTSRLSLRSSLSLSAPHMSPLYPERQPPHCAYWDIPCSMRRCTRRTSPAGKTLRMMPQLTIPMQDYLFPCIQNNDLRYSKQKPERKRCAVAGRNPLQPSGYLLRLSLHISFACAFVHVAALIHHQPSRLECTVTPQAGLLRRSTA